MPAEKMTALIMSGPEDRLDEAISRFVVGRSVHMEDAISALSKMRRLKRAEAGDAYSAPLNRATQLMNDLGIALAPAEFQEYDLKETETFLQDFSEKLDALEQEDKGLAAILERRMHDPYLQCLQYVPESLRDLRNLKYVYSRLGRLSETAWKQYTAEIYSRLDEFVVELKREDGYVYFLALSVPEAADRLDSALVRYNMEQLLPEDLEEDPDCTAAEYLARTEQTIRCHDSRKAEIAKEREALRVQKGPELASRRAWLKYRSVCARTRGCAGVSFGRFYMVGWVPSDQAEAFENEFEAEPGFSCVAAEPGEMKDYARPPVRVRERRIQRVMTPLMKMYGLPAYGTVDPRIFMVVTYSLFFGMMFGDAGQGALLALLGFVLFKKTGAWLWRIIGICGCSAVAFGLFYGSVFGMEDLLPWGGFYPLASENIMPLLLAGAVLGAVVLTICMILNIVNSFRQEDLKSALFSANGAAGLVLYIAVMAAVACAYTGAADLFKGWYISLFILIPVLLMWFGDPLAKKLQGRRDWKPESWGMFLVEGFFDIFEAAISYMSNTLSFLRLGAFAISHAGMMMVVSMLCRNMAAVGTVTVMVLGNILVAALEAALSSIQIIRLEFYEIFGRFYISGGHPFEPVTVDYLT